MSCWLLNRASPGRRAGELLSCSNCHEAADGGAMDKPRGSEMRRAQLLLLVCLLTLLPALQAAAAQKIYRAKLSGAWEVPGVKSPAKGNLKIIASKTEMSFELNVKGITSPTAANIHWGRQGENGPPVAGLFGGPLKLGPFKGVLAEGLITRESLIGELQGKTVEDLARLIESGEAYVNILTVTYPLGEIRGQIK